MDKIQNIHEPHEKLFSIISWFFQLHRHNTPVMTFRRMIYISRSKGCSFELVLGGIKTCLIWCSGTLEDGQKNNFFTIPVKYEIVKI
ncbi:unnamed protein product [Callosobruchus maculatus]|uniref:Uncharacterized protein n=1 Tax=Callosobruchus maculatus TaxID=64391 RepID=A0A653CLF7_CALMS|nr:unnamed protein product [Callosobruchus maculatus]